MIVISRILLLGRTYDKDWKIRLLDTSLVRGFVNAILFYYLDESPTNLMNSDLIYYPLEIKFIKSSGTFYVKSIFNRHHFWDRVFNDILPFQLEIRASQFSSHEFSTIVSFSI